MFFSLMNTLLLLGIDSRSSVYDHFTVLKFLFFRDTRRTFFSYTEHSFLFLT